MTNYVNYSKIFSAFIDIHSHKKLWNWKSYEGTFI